MPHGTSLVFAILPLKWLPVNLPQNILVVRCPLPQDINSLTNATDSSANHLPLLQSEAMRTFRSSTTRPARHGSFGGFPGPRQIISKLVHRFFPGMHRQLRRTVTMPRTTTITSIRGNNRSARTVPYISFDAVVRHNSAFESLTDEQLEELGGVEFRALNALLWIVGIVRVTDTGSAITLITPFM